MLRRILTALVLIPIVIALVWFAPSGLLAVVLGLVLLLALREFFRLGERMTLHGFPVWTGLTTVLLIFSQWSAGQLELRPLHTGVELIRNRLFWSLPLDWVLTIFVFGCMVIALCSRMALPDILPGAGLSAAGLLLVVFPASFLIRLDQVPITGPRWVLFVLVLVWAGDVVAYFTGTLVGHTPLAPLLSPKKTWEGAAGNVVAALLVAYCFAGWLTVDAAPLMLVAGIASIAGQCGDLLESAYKRGAKVKDSGVLLPGHGGMLDRIDSLIFAVPIVWYYVDWLIRNRY
jgi:phosphatidate cytidylyltransferase